jgi:uncharacterized membrane protein
MNIDITEKQNKEKSFATGVNFFKLFWVFYIGCFAGVVIETIWCLVTNGVIQSRTALILSPLNPVYGFGALLMTVCFVRFSNRKNGTIFLGCMVIGGLFEYLCSLFQEMAFGTVSWSYSADVLGIFERTSLIYSVFWGVLGVFWIRVIYPWLSNLIERIPNKVGVGLTYLLLILIVIDMVFSSLAVYRQSQRRQGIPATNIIQEFYDEKLSDDVLKDIYPNMMPVR